MSGDLKVLVKVVGKGVTLTCEHAAPMTPDQAETLARLLLAAAKKARGATFDPRRVPWGGAE